MQRLQQLVIYLAVFGVVYAGINVFVYWPSAKRFFEPAPSTQGVAGVDPGPTHHALSKYAAVVLSAQKKGDPGLVFEIQKTVFELNQRMDDVTRSNSPMWNCKVAMVHLLKGIYDVSTGMPWTRQRQFEAALEDCR